MQRYVGLSAGTKLYDHNIIITGHYKKKMTLHLIFLSVSLYIFLTFVLKAITGYVKIKKKKRCGMGNN